MDPPMQVSSSVLFIVLSLIAAGGIALLRDWSRAELDALERRGEGGSARGNRPK